MPFDPQDLPELGSSQVDPRWLQLLKERKLKGLLGDNTQYELKPSKAVIQSQIDDALLKATLGYNGKIGLHAQHPMFGGLLNFHANGGEGHPNYLIQFEKKF